RVRFQIDGCREAHQGIEHHSDAPFSRWSIARERLRSSQVSRAPEKRRSVRLVTRQRDPRTFPHEPVYEHGLALFFGSGAAGKEESVEALDPFTFDEQSGKRGMAPCLLRREKDGLP